MRSRLLWRRSATAVGVYSAAVFGFLGTVVAARELGVREFGLLAIVLAATGFFQLLLDLTIEEAVVKYGFRYSTREDWGRLRRLFRLGLLIKVAGGLAGGVAIAILAPLSHWAFGARGLLAPMLVAALLPVVQAPEGLAAAALIVRGRYDVRAAFQAASMLVRLVGLAVGALYGVTEAVVGVVLAQVVATGLVSAGGWYAFGRFPSAGPAALGEDRLPFRRFLVQSSIGSGLVSFRGTLGTLLLGIVTSPFQVAYFRAAQAPQAGLANLSAPARLVLLTEQTRDVERGRSDRVYRTLGRYVAGTALLMAVVVPLAWWLMPHLVRLVYGSRYGPASDAARLILLAAAIQLVWGWSKSFPVSIGRPGLRILAHGVELAVLAPLLLVFGGAWGATGAAGAVLASTGAFAALWTVLLVRLRREPIPAAVSPT